jgi:putative lipoprotein
MLVKKVLTFIVLISTVYLTGCGSTSNKTAITGLIDHPHQMTLADGTIVIVRIEDTTRAGAPGKKVAEEIIKSQGDIVPMPFAVAYDPGNINENHTYSISVKIQDSEGKILYTNESSVPVITKGNPTRDIDVMVILADK